MILKSYRISRRLNHISLLLLAATPMIGMSLSGYGAPSAGEDPASDKANTTRQDSVPPPAGAADTETQKAWVKSLVDAWQGGVAPDVDTKVASPSPAASMEAAKEAEFCSRWDVLLHSNAMKCGNVMLPELIACCEETRDGLVHILRYNNAPIVDRVVNLYVAEYQYWLSKPIRTFEESQVSARSAEEAAVRTRTYKRNKEQLRQSIERHGNLFRDLPMDTSGRKMGENEADYLDQLATAAELTFDPRIYDEVWGFPMCGEVHLTYLAKVKPETTIQMLSSATPGFELDGTKCAPDTLFVPDNGPAISFTAAFGVMQRLCESQPLVAKEHVDAIRGFVRVHALHYAKQPDMKYLEVRDFMLRYLALEILQSVGSTADVPLIEKLAENAPEKRPSNSRAGFGNATSIASLAARVRAKVAPAPAP
jgi:hypothetical protein